MSKQKSIDGMVATAPTTNNKSEGSSLRSIAWLGMLFVVLSIGFSSYMVYFGSDNMLAKIMLIPQVAFAAAVAIYKFAFAK